MTESVNPYQPPATEKFDGQFAGRLSFSGIIEPKDYRELMATTTGEQIGWVVFESPVVGFGVPTVVTFFLYQTTLRPLVSLVALACLLTAFLLLQRQYSRKAIARRQLELNPDLLGLAEGEVTRDGLLFFDGTHHYWFGPTSIFTAMVSSRGMRIPVDANPYRYLAITRRLFETYDLSVARRIAVSWRQSLFRGEQPSMAMWDQIGTPPHDAIRLKVNSSVNLMPGLKSPIVIGLKDVLALAVITALGAYNFSQSRWSLLILFGFIGYAVMLLAMLLQRFARRKLAHQFVQDGWITAESLALHHSTAGFRMPTQLLNLKLVDGERLVGTLHSQPFEIHRSMLVDQGDWERLCATLA